MSRRPEDAEGWRVLDEGLARAREVFGPRFVAAYAIGSLAHGGFAPEASDVDLALILDRVAAKDAGRMTGIREHVHVALATPLAGRLSLFWSSWSDLEHATGAGRFPLADRQDLVSGGSPLFGEDLRELVSLPAGEALTRALVIESARFALDKLATTERDALLREPAALAARGCRVVTKAVLFPVRFIYTLGAGRSAGNGEAVARFADRPADPVRELALAALEWRERGALDPRVEALLGDGLLPLYDEFVSRYAEALVGFGEPKLASELRVWNARLQHGGA